MKRGLLLLLALLALAACDSTLWQQPRIERTGTVCGMDESGSMRADLRAAVREVCAAELGRGRHGWVEVRSISDESYANESLVVRSERRVRACPNPFDSGCRKSAQRDAVVASRSMKAAIARVLEARDVDSRGTDIYGFLDAAAEELHDDSTLTRRRIVLATDVEDTAHHGVGDLSGIEVEVYLQLPPSPRRAEVLRKAFRDEVMAAGATAVRFHTLTPALR